MFLDPYAFSLESITLSFTCNWIPSSIEIQRPSRSTLCVICYCHLGHLILTDLLLVHWQLALLNGGSLMGRFSAGFIAPYVSVPRLMTVSTAACGILVLGMIGLNHVPMVVVLGTIYGYFLACVSRIFFVWWDGRTEHWQVSHCWYPSWSSLPVISPNLGLWCHTSGRLCVNSDRPVI